MTGSPPALNPERFHAERPTDLRVARPWHRLAYIIKALPEAIRAASGDLQVQPDARMLDFGCADRPYRGLFPPSVDYLAADLPGNPQANVVINPDGTVPVRDGVMDAVLSTQALEHVADPDLYLAECFRVLRPGGRLLLSTHGMMLYHPDPVDYWRWTSAGLQRLVRGHGFEVVRFEGVMGLASCGLQFFQDGILSRLPRLLRPAFVLPIQSLIGALESLQGDAGRRLNAMVFVLVAEKP